jgi:hypothetical protein
MDALTLVATAAGLGWASGMRVYALSLLGLYAAFKYPLLFLALLALSFVLAIWLLPRIWRGMKRLIANLHRLLGTAA